MNLKKYIKNFIKYLKSGGVVYTNVTTTNPNSRFEGQTVLVTGATSGIGYEIAKQFLSEGANVIVTGRNEANLSSTKDKLNSDRLKTIKWDISDVDTIEEHLSNAVSLFGKIDIFINNAGVYDSGSWDVITPEMFDKVNSINSKGLFFMCQAQGIYLKNAGIKGKIVNICSIAGLISGFNPYSVSKWSSVCITKGIAKELVKYGIVVNGVAPGNVVTNIHDGVKGRDVADNAYMPQHLTERYTLVEEVASLVLYLSGGTAGNIIGQVIAIDGGWSLN